MNCEKLQELLGMRCIARGMDSIEIVTPFTFSDGSGFEIFASTRGEQVHLFDDGFTLSQLHSAGLDLRSKRRWSPLRSIASLYNVTLSDDGVFETLAPASSPSLGFARFISALIGVSSWEREQAGVSADASWLVEEVALYLQAWKPNEKLLRKPSIRGFSGRTLTFDFALNGKYIDAILPHGITTGAELRKLVDFDSSSAKLDSEALIVLDDRSNPEQAKQERDILSRVATVWNVSALIEATSGGSVIQ